MMKRIKIEEGFIIFPKTIQHSVIAHQNTKVVSAGFASLQRSGLVCVGESMTLDVKPKETDVAELTKQIKGV